MKREKNIFSSFWGWNPTVEGKSDFRERESNFSLDFQTFGSSEQETKLLYAVRATRGHQFCGVSTTLGGRGLLLLGYFLFKMP